MEARDRGEQVCLFHLQMHNGLFYCIVDLAGFLSFPSVMLGHVPLIGLSRHDYRQAELLLPTLSPLFSNALHHGILIFK